MPDNFYRDFEARFRGDPAVIRERLRVYEPFLVPLAAQGNALGLDLGCGRGEWLEIMGLVGLEARGVDLDEGMLDMARDKGLAVENLDALQALRSVPASTLAVVSAFHLIEHLAFDQVRELVTEARRALRPGGVMILETPNPENPVVGLINFHLDPTHIKPLPPLLTDFVAEHAGFARRVILRLQGSKPQMETAGTFMSVLTDVSFDYAIVAQVAGPQSGDLDAAFNLKLGLDLYDAIQSLDEVSAAQLAKIYERIGNLEQTVAKTSVGQTTEIYRRLSELERTVANQSVAVSGILFSLERSWLERLLFHPSGRPVRAVRRLLYHTSGKPRGLFRNWVLGPERRPRRAFRQWMESSEYRALPWPSLHREFTPTILEENILAYDPKRPRPLGIPPEVMTVEELIAKADMSTTGREN